MKKPIYLLFLLPLAPWAAPASAQEAAAPEALVVTAQNRTAAQEAERGAAPRQHVAPGDVVRYRLTFTNPTAQPVRGVNLSNPLPPEFRLVAGSTRASRDDARVEYSADGGQSFSPQPMVEVVVDGRRVLRPAAPETYTHVRWTVGGWVAPGATVTAEFDARLAASPRGPGQPTAPGGAGGH